MLVKELKKQNKKKPSIVAAALANPLAQFGCGA
jgi:hypothetical protein